MPRRLKRLIGKPNLDVPLEDKLETVYMKFIIIDRCNTSEASFRTLAFFRETEPKFDSRVISKFVSKIIDKTL